MSAGCPGIDEPFESGGFVVTRHDDDCCERWYAENICGERRGGPRSKVTCELARGHELDPMHGHLGRSRSGRHFSWGLR